MKFSYSVPFDQVWVSLCSNYHLLHKRFSQWGLRNALIYGYKSKSLGKCIILCPFSRIIIGPPLGPVICRDRGSTQRVGDWKHSALNDIHIYMNKTYVHIFTYTCICVYIYPAHSSHGSEIIMKRGRKIVEARGTDCNEQCFINTLGKLHIWTHDVGDNIQKTCVSSEQRGEVDRAPPLAEQLLGINFWKES